MNVIITTFGNPFSFFCIAEDVAPSIKNIILSESNVGTFSNKFDLFGVSHGKYVAVLWNDNWARGVVTLETQFLIWLVDYGIYLRPNEKTVYVNLPSVYKNYPTKVFEASIHGVMPVDKRLNNMCEIENQISNTWSNGAVEKVQELIADSVKTYFVPVAMLSTKTNDVVIGDLYFKLKDRGIVNLVDELQQWPVFLEKDAEIYIKNLDKFYTKRRQHRACLLKPEFPGNELPTITLQTTLEEYHSICADVPQLELDCDENSEEGSTITFLESVCPVDKNDFKLTPAEIEKYANIYVTVSGREYNVLNVLLNKARDLYICERYKDLKSIGRATSRGSLRNNETLE